MINTQEEVAMCDECISHLMENVGPDHLIVKYRKALIELDRLRKIAVDKEEENRLLFSGLAACVISTGQDRLFIPYSILSKKYQVEIFRDPERPMGYTVTAKLAEDGA